jgi:hypothetical protein
VINCLDDHFVGKDEGNGIGGRIHPIAISGTRPAIAMKSVSPASGGIGKQNQIIIVYLGKCQHIATGDVEGRSDELIGIGYVDGDGLLDVLQEVSEYPDRQIACSKAIIVSEIREYRKQLDLIVAGELENTCADIKGQLGSIDDASKKQHSIPIDLNLEVRDVTLMFIVTGEDVILYPGSGKAFENEPFGFPTVIGYGLQLIGRD